MCYLIIYLLLEPVKRIASALFYPLAYVLRNVIRKRDVLTPVIWEDYLCSVAWYWWPLWLMLDDSVFLEYGCDYADKEKYYPNWVRRFDNDFIWAYWWAAIRNSFVNWNNWSAFKTGKMVSEESHDGKRNFYIERTFTSGAKRPYAEFYLFGKWNQVGWISCGRFEIDIMKKKP